jgi:hypothetical protein
MSILGDLIEKKITFSQAVTEVEQWADKLIADDPAFTNATAAIVSDVKQAASDAVSVGDTALGVIIGGAAKALEPILETTLASATKGLSVGLNPLISGGIDAIAAAMIGQINAWALKAKADLATPAK